MSSKPDIVVMLRRLWQHIGARRRRQFFLLFALICVASVFEIVSIGAILPFLGIMIAPQHVFEHPNAQFFIHLFGIETPSQLLLPIAMGFAVAVLIAMMVRLLLVWASARLTFATGADLSIAIYQRTLYQPYAVHIARNSSEVIDGITAKSYRLIHNALLPAITILSSIVMIAAVMIALLAIKPVVSLVAFSGFASIYLAVIFAVKKRLLLDSQLIARESTQIVKALQEGLGGIRDVLIDSAQAQYCRIYQNADLPLRRAQAHNAFIALSPRLVVEAIGMVFISGLAYWLSRQEGGLVGAIPVLGVLALGAQRLLPVLQQAYGAWVSLQGEVASVMDAIDLLDQPLPPSIVAKAALPIPFHEAIRMEDVSFKYTANGPMVLQSVNLRIHKGERVGFIGTTGSGKSTLLDIMMGLLEATDGKMFVDKQNITNVNVRSWQAHIAHVPQAIFLADCSVAENIAFGVPQDQIDMERVRRAAVGAQIADVVEELPQGYATRVGERGVRLSGGQRQRLGIARALYKRASVIVLDEATSALDSETEASVMASLDSLPFEITVLMIAHRLTTLSGCHRIIVLEQGRVAKQGTYAEIVETLTPQHKGSSGLGD